jgi:cellobiose epimerase
MMYAQHPTETKNALRCHVLLLLLLVAVGAAGAAQAAAADSARNSLTAESYRRLGDEVEKHFNSKVLAIWFPRCIDKKHGGFTPHFLEDWSKGGQNDKTLVFQSRMTWVCAQVAIRYPERKTEYLAYTRQGVDLLERVLWDKQDGGFFWGLDENGNVKADYGADKHVYGIAFALYGLSAAFEATGDQRTLELAKRGFTWLERHAHDADHGGYYEALDRSGTPIVSLAQARARVGISRTTDLLGTEYGCKSMNSHIHLLEALTALYGVWPDPLVEKRLQEMFLLVRDTITVKPGYLNLFFRPDWRPVPGLDSFGHDIETAYLLLEAAEVLKQPNDAKTLAVARQLVDHAMQWGWDEAHGGFYDHGTPSSPASGREKVWWTQAEGLNSLLLMHARFGDKSRRYFDAFLKQWDFIENWQTDRQHGEWYEVVSAEGIARPRQAKGTVWKAAYHNGRALMNVSETLRRLARDGIDRRP